MSWVPDPGGESARTRTRQRTPMLAVVAMWCASFSLHAHVPLGAQGVSTASIRGIVRSESATAVDGAEVRVLNAVTGYVLNTRVAGGRFLVHGLEVGGPYVVEVRHLRYSPYRGRPFWLSLGQRLDVDVVLLPLVTRLDEVVVAGEVKRGPGAGGIGVSTVVSDSLLERLPTLNRSFLDFVQLAPQVSTKVGFQRSGMSAAGANLRFNSYLINGTEESSVNSNVSPGHIGKSIPIDAVREYQVNVAPFDVRYGDFAGAVVNTVTQSGTNEFHGSAFAYWRNNRLARGEVGQQAETYERLQTGFSFGGPIVRDRVHFFIAPEIQELTSPAAGPYFGQPPASVPALPVSEANVTRFGQIMSGYGLDAGSGGYVEVGNPLRNLFARLDVALPAWNSRAIGFLTYARAEDRSFERSVRDFFLSSARRSATTELRLVSLQFRTTLPAITGAHNELILSQTSERTDQVPDARQPLVRVLVPGTGVSMIAGSPELAHGRFRRSQAFRVKDELMLPWGTRHLLTLGMQAERFRIQPGGVEGGYGSWTFSSFDDLQRGTPDRFELRTDLGSASALLRGGQYAAYVADEWRGNRWSVSLGVRADLLDLGGRTQYNATVDSVFGRRTDELPRPRLHLSPRFGFTWDPDGSGRQQLRGGLGVFTGRPPLAWLQPALANHGLGVGLLRCGFLPGDDGPPPPFVPDYRDPPSACLNGPSSSPQRGDVNLLDRNLRMAQAFRTSLAYVRMLPWGVSSVAELLLTRYLSDFMFVNLNLVGPQSADHVGRVMYGSLGANGVPEVALRTARFAEVIDLTNTGQNSSHQLSLRLEKPFTRGFAAITSYSYSRTRDVQSPSRVNLRGTVLWSDARAVSGRHDDTRRGVSLNDLPHRAVAALTWAAPWSRWKTVLSWYYVGESGSPFTYRAWGNNRRGDLNADGSNTNDPIYVPRDVFNNSEIAFIGASDSTGADNSAAVQAERIRAQRSALHQFIDASSCLRRQRGRIVERNSCREPWSNSTIASLRQSIQLGQRAVDLELDVFNVVNLLNAGWGQYRIADPQLLEHVGQVGTAVPAQPMFRFNATRSVWTTLASESVFQLQIAIRYRF